MSAVNEIPARISQRLSPEQLCYATCAGSIDVHEHKCTYCRDELDADAKAAGDQLQIRGLTFFDKRLRAHVNMHNGNTSFSRRVPKQGKKFWLFLIRLVQRLGPHLFRLRLLNSFFANSSVDLLATISCIRHLEKIRIHPTVWWRSLYKFHFVMLHQYAHKMYITSL